MRIAGFGLIIIALLVVLGCTSAYAQYVRKRKTYTDIKTGTSPQSKDVKTSSEWYESDDTYTIYLHTFIQGKDRGKTSAFIWKKSRKTGNLYRKYLPDGQNMAETILKEQDNGR